MGAAEALPLSAKCGPDCCCRQTGVPHLGHAAGGPLPAPFSSHLTGALMLESGGKEADVGDT